MALELTRAKKPVYPTKTTINLAESNQAPRHLGRDLALFVLALVVIALFAKFGVIDVMGAASAASAKVSSAQAQLDDLEAGNADYSALQERYDSFAVNSLTAEELSLSDRKDVLALLENTVASTAELQTVVISGNVVELQFANASLDDVSRVVASLVAGVSMSTAKTDKHDDVVSTVTILLVGAYGGTAGADAEDGVASGAEGAAAGMATGDASGAGDAADAGGQNGAKHE